MTGEYQYPDSTDVFEREPYCVQFEIAEGPIGKANFHKNYDLIQA